MRHFGQPPGATKESVSLQIIRSKADLVLASYGQVCVAVWNAKPTLELFEEQRVALAACAQRNPGRALFLCVVATTADPPEGPVRQASAKMVRDHAKDLLGCACVIEGTGFRAAATRSILIGMTLVARTPVPMAFFEHIPGAVSWLNQRSGQSLAGLGPQLLKLRSLGT